MISQRTFERKGDWKDSYNPVADSHTFRPALTQLAIKQSKKMSFNKADR
jgi:hypothetical protein